ncbi:tRNA-dihydrouridine synthase family protein [Clostridium sp. MSJ-8]|uniref:tRNA dihydrouridine synthase n=1 Tax=Clostridium sp. MSJ-8 TaxID=2841510 RepID=UPI001C0EB99F|nr:tRNA-dihydrouridine synthase family protein [Clostridium sp. MSJ-8]MBU5487589.1 tRNA-dihydrouridine synthase family protein [Clostridium sp. MSJ-8]
MKIYFAPMEGITGDIYRRTYNKYFDNIDKYFTPFIAPHQNKIMNYKEKNDILPENNKGMVVVPQILTNSSEDFIKVADKLIEYGYDEVNLNLGCPSGTVVSKNKGSGFLSEREALDKFLEEIFNKVNMKISIKTRNGRDNHEEFYKLIEIYNKYPLEELIVHPRIQKDFYKNKPNMDIFSDAIKLSKNKLCYNGDIFTKDNYNAFEQKYNNIDMVMLGRGIIANPGLTNEIKNNTFLNKQDLRNFVDELLEEYMKRLQSEKNVLFKMKEIWSYMIYIFSNNKKYNKRIKKSQRMSDYLETLNDLFSNEDIVENQGLFE